MIRTSTISLFVCVLLTTLCAQNTVGVLSYNSSFSYDGYNLIYPHNQPNVYLLDNCGQIVHTWEDDNDFRPANTAYIMENGNLVKTKRNTSIAGDVIWAGGGGAMVEIRDWDNNLLWNFELNDSLRRLHHDIAVLPNGNILMLAWELKDLQETVDAGRDTTLIVEGELWPDYIIEVRPTLNSSDFDIVWEWHIWDHLVQDFDENKSNFGVVADNPQLVDLNWDTSDGEADWMHGNALDYNHDLNQILLSVPTFNEVWVIDHSTSTQEAAGHFGGFGGRGGDLLYRWGNAAAYDQGTADDQTLFFQHDAHWVDEFIDQSHPQFGKIAVFNNRVGSNYSSANVFAPTFDMYMWNYPMTGDIWEPADFDITTVHPVDSSLFHSTGLSSVQILPNGNMLICAGRWGYTAELTPDDRVVWEYKTPLRAGQAVNQGDSLLINNNLTFRLKRYPTDFIGFSGRDLIPNGYLELNPDVDFCDSLVAIGPTPSPYHLKIYPNPARKMATIEWDNGGKKALVEVYDALGIRHASMELSGGRKYLDVSTLNAGLYFVQINRKESRKLMIQR